MKILYAIQGTGNGQVSRATEVLPVIRRYADVDVFVSGGNSNIDLPFPVKYNSKGFSFEYDNHGRLNLSSTFRKIEPLRLWKEIRDLPVKEYDLVINDFEFISARSARYHNVPSISFSHQAALLSDQTPRPSGFNAAGKLLLSQYAPAPYAIGLHFHTYDDFIFTPVIRKEIRMLQPQSKGHYAVYLPAVGDKQLLQVLHQLPEMRWEVFSRTTSYPYIQKNVSIRPAQNEAFIKSLEMCNGLLTGAGFESPAEAMYLGKKLFVIPIHGQYEQQCNAAALKKMGVRTADRFSEDLIPELLKWAQSTSVINVHYPDITEKIVEQMLFDPQPYFLPALGVG